ncbi:hematopoietic SH2 domain-containing protein [Octodon degus]|uniref:Hematopoietic SH2 domain-containing protein n=1 Tax=Octodon degus TaxID=10160 RepID=A0A6P3FHS1_OCTDE|nr:hematopoietic SH2 domain-containing protein [Octodon degus]
MAGNKMLPPPLPPRLDWFVHTQMGQLAQDGIPEWFHGAISRGDAETLLELKPPGSFLVRVSHSHVGYTLSYRVQDRCCHAMVTLLDDGRLVLRGEDVAHTSLCALVAFHQHRPLQPHGQLLTQGCGQKDPATVDYEDLLFCATILAQDTASPEPGPEEHQGPCWGPEGPPAPAQLHPPKDKAVSAEKATKPVEQVTSLWPPRVPLQQASQKLWQHLRALPAVGRRVQQRLKGHLDAMSLTPLSGAWPSAPTPFSRTTADSQGQRAPREPHVATSMRESDTPSRKATRPATWSKATPGNRGWHQKLRRTLSAQPPEPTVSEWLPEEYLPPPPFAPGYC